MSFASHLSGLHVQDIRNIRGTERSRLLDVMAGVYHAHWKCGTEGYHSQRAARKHLKERLETDRVATFVALTPCGKFIGTAAVGTDDFYDGFCRSNGLDACWVGRDLFTAPWARGMVQDGLKVWQHLLKARLNWLDAHGHSAMAVFTEPALWTFPRCTHGPVPWSRVAD